MSCTLQTGTLAAIILSTFQPYFLFENEKFERVIQIWVSLNCRPPQAVDTCGLSSKLYKLRVWNANLT